MSADIVKKTQYENQKMSGLPAFQIEIAPI
jgi:hypothetical protein